MVELRIERLLRKGVSIAETSRKCHVGHGTVQRSMRSSDHGRNNQDAVVNERGQPFGRIVCVYDGSPRSFCRTSRNGAAKPAAGSGS